MARRALQRLQRNVEATLGCAPACATLSAQARHAGYKCIAHAPMCTSSCSVSSVSASVAAVEAGAGVDRSKVNTLRAGGRVSACCARLRSAGGDAPALAGRGGLEEDAPQKVFAGRLA